MPIESIDLLPLGAVLSAVLLVLAGLLGGIWERWLKALGVLAFMAALAALAWNMSHTVRPGTVGVQVLHGKTLPSTLAPGRHAVHPMTHFQEMVTRRQVFGFEGPFALKQTRAGEPPITVEVTLPWQLTPEAAPFIYETIGGDAIYTPQLRTTVQAALSDALAATYIETDNAAARARLLYQMNRKLDADVTEALSTYGFTEAQAKTAFTFGKPEITRLCVGECNSTDE